ncbi:MAG: lanthionine synthetase LanC family protein [Candidatus Kariarchaeaceae archaeon]|jgi:hypothetical protein
MVNVKYQKLLFVIIFTLFIHAKLLHTSYAQIPTTPYFDDKTYLGVEYGAAGIALSFLETYQSTIFDENYSSEILTSSLAILDQIWEDRIEYEGQKYASWAKTTQSQSIYPGKKYGPSGILEVFLQIYQITQDPKWMQRIEEGYWLLASQANNQTNYPNWPYAYSMPKEEGGIAITDLKYGSAGVLELNLQLYKATNDSRYLEHGEKIISWLDLAAVEITQNNIPFQVIPWYFYDSVSEEDKLALPYYTSYGFGLAGIAPLLFHYATLLKSSAVKDWAISMGSFLTEIQLEDGSWSAISDRPRALTSFDEGVAGVVYGLNKLKNLANTDQFDNAIEKGIDWLFSRFVANYSHTGFYETDSDALVKTNLFRGSLGILRVLNELSSFLTSDQESQLVKSYQWLLTEGSFYIATGGKELLFLLQDTLNYEIIDFSYSEGLAGLLSELVHLYSSPLADKLNFNLTRAISASVSALDYFQDSDGYWQKQYLIPAGWNLEHYTIEDYASGYSTYSNPQNTSEEASSTNDAQWQTTILILIPVIVFTKRKRKHM